MTARPYRVTHKRTFAYRYPRALCGRGRWGSQPKLTNDDDEVDCLRCQKRLGATAEVKALWARRVADSL